MDQSKPVFGLWGRPVKCQNLFFGLQGPKILTIKFFHIRNTIQMRHNQNAAIFRFKNNSYCLLWDGCHLIRKDITKEQSAMPYLRIDLLNRLDKVCVVFSSDLRGEFAEAALPANGDDEIMQKE